MEQKGRVEGEILQPTTVFSSTLWYRGAFATVQATSFRGAHEFDTGGQICENTGYVRVMPSIYIPMER